MMINKAAYRTLIIDDDRGTPIPMKGDVITDQSLEEKAPSTEVQYTAADGTIKSVDAKWFKSPYCEKIRKVVQERYGKRQVSLKVLCEIASELEAKEEDAEVASWFGLQ